jgi:tether containing UBX domain for GLUT4
MSAHVKVVNTSFQQATIKVTPGKYLSDVIEEACKGWKMTASNYTVK